MVAPCSRCASLGGAHSGCQTLIAAPQYAEPVAGAGETTLGSEETSPDVVDEPADGPPRVYIDRNNCLEIIAVRGKPAVVDSLVKRLKSVKGLKYVSLAAGTTGERLA